MVDHVGWKPALTAALGKVGETLAVEQVTLNANLDYTLPTGTPAGVVHRVVFTQDGTGGHKVTYGGNPVTVDPTAGASTLVEVWPGGAVVYPGAAAPAGTASSTITADDTPAAPAEGTSASYLVTSSVSWPAGLVWSADPDNSAPPTVVGSALVTLATVGGVTLAMCAATFPDTDPPTVPDTDPPTVPTGLTATASSPTTIVLGWTASTDNVGATGYEYRIGAGAAVDAGAGTTETVGGLTAETLYSFTVRAYDAAGNRSGWSAAASATTPAVPAVTLESAILALNPVGYWKLRETTGKTAADSSGNGLNGTYSGGTLAGQDGAYSLTAAAYMQVADNDLLTAAGGAGWTTFALIRPTALTATHYVVSKSAEANYEWGQAVTPTHVRGVYWALDAVTELLYAATETVAVNTWQAVAWAADAPAAGATSNLYRNATALSVTKTGTATTFSNGTGALRVGIRTVGSGGFVGAVQHVAVFPAKLTAGQIATLVSVAQAEGLIP